MEIKTRNELQEYAANLAKKNNYLFEFCTGLGKTRIPLMIIKPEDKVLIIHGDRVYYRISWTDEIEKVNPKLNPEFTTLQSVNKYIDTKWDYIIFDEGDLATENYLESIKTMEAKRYIFLAAKVTYEKYGVMRQICDFKKWKVTLSEATQKGWLPAPEIRVIYLQLDNEDRKFTFTKRPKVKEQITIDYPQRWDYWENKKVGLTVRCTAKEYHEYVSYQIEYLRKIGKHDAANFKGAHLKMWLAEQKDGIVNRLLRQCRENEQRVVTFLGSITQCDRIAGNNPKVHSKQDEDINKENIRKFSEGEVNELHNVNSLTRAVSLTSENYLLDVGIILTLTNNTVQTYQRLGRLMRAEKPIIYFPIFRGTKEEDKFQKLIREINQEYKVVQL